MNPWITFTLQILNVMEPMTMIEWNIQNQSQKLNRLAKTPWFTQHPVHNPKYYCVTSLPQKAKVMLENNTRTGCMVIKEWCNDLSKDYLLP